MPTTQLDQVFDQLLNSPATDLLSDYVADLADETTASRISQLCKGRALGIVQQQAPEMDATVQTQLAKELLDILIDRHCEFHG